MTPQETFNKGLALKLEGNEEFKKGNYKESLAKYYSAILHLKTVGGNKHKAQFDKRSNEQLALIYNNMAAVNLKQENWVRAKENAQKSLELDSTNMKAKFRLAQANMRQNYLDEAEPLLKEVLAANPGDRAVLDEMENFKKQSKSMEDKEKATYQKMMAKLNDEVIDIEK
ncbi:hypothetical protein BC941DRAFT_447965 [Chlamydoabsidia padenii]|nr:hypothetical protein BC941DRAFT_447965 [Chlamydoabsidia padenii]